MNKVDYIIVGLGIAGLSLCEKLYKANKTFVVIDGGVSAATLVSGGLFNPVVLKRFTPAWMGKDFLAFAMPFYENLSEKLGENFVLEQPIYRILHSVEEQNNWLVASDKIELAPFMASKIKPNPFKFVNAPYGFGEVIHSGKIAMDSLFSKYKTYLKNDSRLLSEVLDYSLLSIHSSKVSYKNMSAENIIFSEGAGVINNPFFNKDCLIPNKGEYVIVKAPQLKLTTILKGGMFVIPLGNDLYKVGATYARGETNLNCTTEARHKIIQVLDKMINCSYEVVNQIAGIRPTTKDRRPLVGKHKNIESIYFLNGLGTRGIMGAPYLAAMLIDHIENGAEIPSEINIARTY